MANVDVSSSIVVFPDGDQSAQPASNPESADYLLSRELAERAAAKRSKTQVGRRAHQELAALFASRRKDAHVAA